MRDAAARRSPAEDRTLVAAAPAPLRVLAAGSLKAALTEIAAAHRRRTGMPIDSAFGAAGLLRRRIAAGETADIFASANMEHPRAIAAARGLTARAFARNRLCALVQPHVGATPDNLLERLLDPAVKVGMSTPRADPSGDYAFALFDRSEALVSGAARRLKAKALQITGTENSPKPPVERSLYGWVMETGQADIFLTYRTNATVAATEVEDLRIVELPQDLAVDAEYGLVVLSDRAAGAAFAGFILSPDGQAILAAHGFSPPAGAPSMSQGATP